MIAVKATREGLLGGKTASGYRVDRFVPFVALPSTAALRCWVRVQNPRNGHEIRALVLDVGPWNEKDHAYVFQPATVGPHTGAAVPVVRPQAETGVDSFGRVTNKAGIDLGERVWDALGMTDNDTVLWEFA
jgi:hypothetical protein